MVSLEGQVSAQHWDWSGWYRGWGDGGGRQMGLAFLRRTIPILHESFFRTAPTQPCDIGPFPPARRISEGRIPYSSIVFLTTPWPLRQHAVYSLATRVRRPCASHLKMAEPHRIKTGVLRMPGDSLMAVQARFLLLPIGGSAPARAFTKPHKSQAVGMTDRVPMV